ncbi:phage protein [Rugosibacter aromaticivorans]|uniref:Phage protein n=1 Tax=Rugosibacter aromaticivorans TaxID=1565605 RepID=A0A0C5J8J6_9PROT|nr:BrnT family toxin [Rugosibacter aromaticivorans]AJP48280.1 phage protein [Rugosibacter aromaticivorans]TBR15097.1 MAG: BrnT family toxin [Rugosibacter sp.]
MQITFDEAKDALNKSKHGLSLSEAEKLEWDDALIWQDTRRDYGEARMVALGVIGARLYCVIYVDREDARRIISLRKANYKEGIQYANQN